MVLAERLRDYLIVAIILLRRASDSPRSLGSLFRRSRRYEVRSDSETRVMTLHQLDALLGARSTPADFWACVNAADAAFAAGDTDARFEWPSGRRVDRT